MGFMVLHPLCYVLAAVLLVIASIFFYAHNIMAFVFGTSFTCVKKFLYSYIANKDGQPHSKVEIIEYDDIVILAHPCKCSLANTAYVVICKKTNKTIFIDPIEPKLILKTVQEWDPDFYIEPSNVNVFSSHCHFDHDVGNSGFLEIFKDVKIFGGSSRVSCVNQVLSGKEVLNIGKMEFHFIRSAFHTTDHLTLILKPKPEINRPGIFFTGDTLFVGGAGRFFEGTGHEASEYFQKIIKFPNYIMMPAHEYAEQDLEFAIWLEPENKDAQKFYKEVKAKRKEKKLVLGTTIEQELLFNPFLRCVNSTLEYDGLTDDFATNLTLLRKLKNDGLYKKKEEISSRRKKKRGEKRSLLHDKD